MQQQSHRLIEYFRRCYRADSYDLSIANIAKIPKNRRLFMVNEDALASGQLPRLPLVGEVAAGLLEQADSYRRERRLVYGCIIATGKLSLAGGFANKRQLCAPLVYFPATLYEDEDLYLELDTSDARANLPLLRQLLKPDMDSSVADDFPLPHWPLESDQIAAMARWLQKYTVLEEIEELGRWPKLEGEGVTVRRAREDSPRLTSACCLVLADRSRSVRGVLHELAQLGEVDALPAPLAGVLAAGSGTVRPSRSAPEMLPGLLSEAQTRALDNAAGYPLSLVSGPPGTGKSFTIAAMAIDRMLHGESVLVVSRTAQAIDVVGSKLKADYGLEAGYVHAGERGFLRSLKAHLDTLLKEGIEQPPLPAKKLRARLEGTRRKLRRAERRFGRGLGAARLLGAGRLPSWLSRFVAGFCHPLIRIDALWRFHNSIGDLRRRFEKQSADYLNAYRLEQLAQLLETERGNLSRFNQALRARTSKKQAERFGEMDFGAVLRAYPIWLVGVDELDRMLPFSPEIFDLVIFDESTQCDIASALPALFRARRAVVVGDGKQLRHVSFLSMKRQEAIWRGCELDGCLPSKYSYRDQSLLDLVSDAIENQGAVTMLDEHYRSRPELIAFSNRHFYGSRLKVMQSRPGASSESALVFHRVDGRRTPGGRNSVEKDRILEELQRHIDRYHSSPVKPSVGVLSPYREQAEYLDAAVRKAFAPRILQDFSLRASTPYGFQGEERDLMLLSMCIDSDSIRAAAYLNRPDMFNVAVTRAREKLLVIHSIDRETLSQDNLLCRYLSFAHGADARSVPGDFLCAFAREVSTALSGAGINTWVGFSIAGQEIDVVCEYAGNTLGIDLIGYPGEFVEHFSVQTYKTLHRAGIPVVPLPYLSWERDRAGCLDRLTCVVTDAAAGRQPGAPETGKSAVSPQL